MTTSILFACNMNSVRSPMAAALLRRAVATDERIDSAGVYEGGLDPFVETVMGEIGVSMQGHEPKTLAGLNLETVDLLVALTPEAASEARKFMPRNKIEYWETENPSEERGDREAILVAYRRVRDALDAKLRQRFPELYRNS